MRAILIDDEKHALDALGDLLSGYSEVEVVGTFTNPLQALEQAADCACEVAFIDIEMPGMKGLELADRLLQRNSDLHIIFITAYDQYAVEAFEINALDYLLKPVSRKRMAKAMQRLLSKQALYGAADDSGERCNARILCLDRFHIECAQGQESPLKWRMAKARELCAYLVHLRGQVVHKDKIVENLWPEMEQDKAIIYLHTCIYQIRKMISTLKLSEQMSLRRVNEGYQLVLTGITCDVDQFILLADSQREISDASIKVMEQAVELYRGDYYENEDFPWSSGRRAELQFIYYELVIKLAEYYMGVGKTASAIKLLHQGVARNPLHEGFHILLMQVFAQIGDHAALTKHFNHVKQLFIEELGMELRLSEDGMMIGLKVRGDT